MNKIYPLISQFIPGIVYVEYSCTCIFKNETDKIRKKRVRGTTRKGIRKNFVFCPLHPKTSVFTNRFKICPNCEEKISSSTFLAPGNCSKCHQKVRRTNYDSSKKKCLQYGKRVPYLGEKKIKQEPYCKNRNYCLSFFMIDYLNSYLQCADCDHYQYEFMEE